MLPTPDTSHVDYDKIYEPAEDSFLLLDTLSSDSEIAFLHDRFQHSGAVVLDVGTGSGVVIAFVNAHAGKIFGSRSVITFGVDMNQFACVATTETAIRAAREHSKTSGRFMGSFRGDLTCSWKAGSVDVLIFNPPYVPTPELPQQSGDAFGANGGSTFENSSYLLSLSYAGGKDGMETTNRLLAGLPLVLSQRGCAYILLCAQNKPEEVKDKIRGFGLGWYVETVGSSGKKAGWEQLQIIRVWREE